MSYIKDAYIIVMGNVKTNFLSLSTTIKDKFIIRKYQTIFSNLVGGGNHHPLSIKGPKIFPFIFPLFLFKEIGLFQVGLALLR